MPINLSAHQFRRRRVVVVMVMSLLALTGIGFHRVLTDDRLPASPSARTRSGDEVSVRIEGTLRPAAESVLRPVGLSSDPESFAASVASALFDWDTGALTSQGEYVERLIEVADPSGEESAGLVADIANYLPTPAAWASLREFGTRQWLEVTSAEIPSLWSEAVAQAGADGLLPGTAAYTIEGVRHREGVWEGAPVASAHEVSFTVFIVCAPSYPTCHLLRLSRPDTPLG